MDGFVHSEATVRPSEKRPFGCARENALSEQSERRHSSGAQPEQAPGNPGRFMRGGERGRATEWPHATTGRAQQPRAPERRATVSFQASCPGGTAKFLSPWLEKTMPRDTLLPPIFRTVRRRRELTEKRLDHTNALVMVKRRVKAVRLPPAVCNQSFQVTGITAYLNGSPAKPGDSRFD